jgi:hypothetical protein
MSLLWGETADILKGLDERATIAERLEPQAPDSAQVSKTAPERCARFKPSTNAVQRATTDEAGAIKGEGP